MKSSQRRHSEVCNKKINEFGRYAEILTLSRKISKRAASLLFLCPTPCDLLTSGIAFKLLV